MHEAPEPLPSDQQSLAPYMEEARKALEVEPSQEMRGFIAKSPADDDWKFASLKPASTPFARPLVGRSFLDNKPYALGSAGVLLGLGSAAAMAAANGLGYLSELQETALLLALALHVLVVGATFGVGSCLDEKDRHRPSWQLHRSSPRSGASGRGDSALGEGEEARLARHSAAALWSLHDGQGARTWRSKDLVEWRARLDLRSEAVQTIRSAGALQELREALFESPAQLTDEARAARKDDYAIYTAGLDALRERVEQQVALQLMVTEIGRRQALPPAEDPAALAGRIAADMPAHEQAIENLSAITSESSDLLDLLDPTHLPELCDGQSAAALHGDSDGGDGRG